jgi:hypothetical protein
MNVLEFCGVTFTDRGPSVTERRLGDLEALAGVPLPAAYREFLCTVNGGRPYPSGFKLSGDDQTHEEYLQQLRDEIDELRRSRNLREIEKRTEWLRFEENVSVPRRVNQLFSIGTGESNALESVLQKTRDEKLDAPFTTVPIGMANADQIISICFEPEYNGHVVVLSDPVGPDELLEIEDFGAGILAESFEHFLRHLFPARLAIKEGYDPPAQLLMSLGVAENFSE